jgi:hypothetical protein
MSIAVHRGMYLLSTVSLVDETTFLIEVKKNKKCMASEQYALD